MLAFAIERIYAERDVKAKLSPQERQSEILKVLAGKGTVDVSELAERFGVSEMSIRNDLNLLSDQGKLIRRYGGAESTQQVIGERPLTEKQKQNYHKKYLICKKAASLLTNGMSVMLDAGTTAEHIVDFLDNITQLTVITNGVNLINGLISRPDIQVYTVGGRVDPRSYSILGEDAEKSLSRYVAEIAFITADGISLVHGVTNNSQEASRISRQLIQNSVSKILLADSSKIEKVGVFPLCGWDQIETLVTDPGIHAEFKEAIESLGVEVLVSDEI